MNQFDPDMRSRALQRYLAAALGLLIVFALVGLAMGRPFASRVEVLATRTPGPSATTAPSPTPMPTAPQHTPTPPATFSPESAWRVLFQDLFESSTTWPAAQEQGWASGYESGRYWLKLNGQRTLSYSVPIDAPEFRAAVDLQVQSGDAGLLFLAGEPKIAYRFLLDGGGRYRLERQQDGETTALHDWAAADALRSGPEATNRIEVERVEGEIRLFANDAELMRYTLPGDAALQGRAGMTIDAVARDAPALAYFDNLVVRVPVVPAER